MKIYNQYASKLSRANFFNQMVVEGCNNNPECAWGAG